MDTILLKDVPRKCPQCDVYIFTEAPRPKIGKRAWSITGVGILVTAIWFGLILKQSDFYILPGRGLGLIVAALLYGWPFYLSALIAWKLPLEVPSKCFKCKTKKTYKIGNPKM